MSQTDGREMECNVHLCTTGYRHGDDVSAIHLLDPIQPNPELSKNKTMGRNRCWSMHSKASVLIVIKSFHMSRKMFTAHKLKLNSRRGNRTLWNKLMKVYFGRNIIRLNNGRSVSWRCFHNVPDSKFEEVFESSVTERKHVASLLWIMNQKQGSKQVSTL